ncbi:hypothetical protein BJ944DRAFT_245355 [Cunninghamella echinulata]|nr:hypothetical protein BJ944DRAFT_245355 [Cunninghamella echinulata]
MGKIKDIRHMPDNDSSSSIHEKMQIMVDNIENPEEQEKKIVKALDIRMMPLFCIFYFTDYLDRANIGNATFF